jgi:O-antigen/teichoic acid export membrane protein
VLKLAGGTAGGQVIAVAAAPILTRLYGPESFGILATFVSILALLNVVSSLRYELAIPIPKEDDEAISLVWLCFVLVLFSTTLTFLGIHLWGSQFAAWLHQPKLKPFLWLLPVTVMLTGVYQPLSYLAIRRKQFGLLAKTKFTQSIYGVTANFVVAPLGAVGLIIGQIVSQSAGISQLMAKIYLPHDFFKQISKNLIGYRDIGGPSVLAGLINVIGAQVPILLLANNYSVFNLGILSVAERLSMLPASLVALSTGQVFLQRLASIESPREAFRMFRSTSASLVKIAFISCVIVILVSPLMPVVLGKDWQKASQILLCLIPLLFSQIAFVPLGIAFEARRRMKEGIIAQLVLTLFRIVPLFILVYFSKQDFSVAVLAYSTGSLMGYVGYFLILMKSIKPSASEYAH